MTLIGTSRIYETEPVEVQESQPTTWFVAELRCGLPAIELLRYCQGIESALDASAAEPETRHRAPPT